MKKIEDKRNHKNQINFLENNQPPADLYNSTTYQYDVVNVDGRPHDQYNNINHINANNSTTRIFSNNNSTKIPLDFDVSNGKPFNNGVEGLISNGYNQNPPSPTNSIISVGTLSSSKRLLKSSGGSVLKKLKSNF